MGRDLRPAHRATALTRLFGVPTVTMFAPIFARATRDGNLSVLTLKCSLAPLTCIDGNDHIPGCSAALAALGFRSHLGSRRARSSVSTLRDTRLFCRTNVVDKRGRTYNNVPRARPIVSGWHELRSRPSGFWPPC